MRLKKCLDRDMDKIQLIARVIDKDGITRNAIFDASERDSVVTPHHEWESLFAYYCSRSGYRQIEPVQVKYI